MTLTPAYNYVTLMCAPKNTWITPEAANIFQTPEVEAEFKNDPEGVKEKILREWSALYEAAHNPVLLNNPDNSDTVKYYDDVFTADASLTHFTKDGYFTILSKFTNVQRQPEVMVHKKAIEDIAKKYNLKNHRFVEAPFNTEGTGDNVYDPFRNVFWSGYTDNTDSSHAAEGRSDLRAHKVLAAESKTQVNSLKTANGQFHIDTSLAPLPRGQVVLYPAGIDSCYTKNKMELFNKMAFGDYGMDPKKNLLLVNEQDAEKFACNLVDLGENRLLVSAAASKEFREALKRLEYDLVEVATPYLDMLGGGAHCCMQKIPTPVSG